MVDIINICPHELSKPTYCIKKCPYKLHLIEQDFIPDIFIVTGNNFPNCIIRAFVTCYTLDQLWPQKNTFKGNLIIRGYM